MALRLAVPLFGPVLADPDLVALEMLGDDRLDLDLGQVGTLDDGLPRAVPRVKQRPRADLRTLVRGDAVDEHRVALLDPVLLAAHFDDRVGQCPSSPSNRSLAAPERENAAVRPCGPGGACPWSRSILAAPPPCPKPVPARRGPRPRRSRPRPSLRSSRSPRSGSRTQPSA